jgi:hypothetical protein
MSPLIFNLDTKCRRVVSLKPRHVPRRKECQLPLTVGGWLGILHAIDVMEKKKIWYLCRDSNPMTKSLYRLYSAGCYAIDILLKELRFKPYFRGHALYRICKEFCHHIVLAKYAQLNWFCLPAFPHILFVSTLRLSGSCPLC